MCAQATEWFGAELRRSAAEIADLFKKYRLSEALMEVYRLLTDEFSGWLLEMVKPVYGEPIDTKTLQEVKDFFNDLLHLLHPFMPFISEELWQHISERGEGESLMVDVSAIDTPRPADKDVLDAVALLKTAVQGVRAIRNAKNIAKKEELSLQVVGENPIEALGGLLAKMAGTTPAERVEKKSDDASAFIVGTTEFAVPLGHLIDVSAEIEKAEADLKHLEGFLAGVLKKLSNERFVANAPEAVVALERKKQSDAEQKIAVLKETLAKLKK